MKSIIEKFRRVPRYGVAVILAAACCFSASADCTVQWDDVSGGWWINCNFGDSFFVPADDAGGGDGGGGGSCTNCTSMTPAECQEAKERIVQLCGSLTSYRDTLQSAIYSSSATVNSTLTMVNQLINEGDNFYTFSDSGSVTGDNVTERIEFLKTQMPTSPYLWEGSAGTSNSKLYHLNGGNTAVYNYYNDGVKPVLVDIRNNLVMSSIDLDNASVLVNDSGDFIGRIEEVANGMNCSACSGGGGGGGGGGSGSGTTSSGCPCSEFINAVKTAVDNCKVTLDSINTKVGAIKTRLEQWDEIIKQIKNDVYSIRQTTDRMDDFFRDDTEVNFKKLIEHVITLSNAVVSAELKLPPNLYWTEYTNATTFVDDSDTSIDWLQKGKAIEAGADGAVIDFGEYQGLNWFQRMEFLLGHIAGIFSPTNSTSSDFSSEEKEKAEDAQDVFDGLTFDDEKSVLQQMVQYVENIEDSLNPFHGLFDYSSGSVRSITFLPDVSVENDLLGNTMPTITMDLTEAGDGSFSISDLVDLAHNLTTFLWYVSFLIIDVLAIIKFVQCLIALNRWYWKIYNSWVSTMFSGGGR